jgi:hypothetical protein
MSGQPETSLDIAATGNRPRCYRLFVSIYAAW